MAIEAERLLVTVVSRGADATSREIRDVGDSAIESARDVTVFSGALESADGEALEFAGTMQMLQGRIDAVSDEFSQVRNASAGATAAISSYAGAALSALGVTTSLQTGLDQTSDELNEVRNSAAGATGAMGAYQGATLSSALATYTMHDALIAGAIPSLTVLLSTLGPLITTVGSLGAGVVSLAGAFGLIAGTAYVAFMRDATAETAELKNALGAVGPQLYEIVGTFGNQFIPMITHAVRLLPEFVQNVLDAAGSMQPFIDHLYWLGDAAEGVIPIVVGQIMDFARRTIPVWKDFLQYMGREIPAAMRFFADIVSRTWDSLHSLTETFLETLAVMTDFGAVATNVVAPMLETILVGFQDLLKWVMDLPGPIRDVTIALSALAPVLTVAAVGAAEVVRIVQGMSGTFTTANTAVARLTPTFATMAKMLGVVASAAVALALAYERNFARVRDATDRVAQALRTELIKTFRVAQSTIGPILRDLAGLFSGFGQAVEQTLGQISMAVANQLVAAIRTAGAGVREGLRQIGAFWTQHRETVLSTLQQLDSQIQTVLTTALSAFRTTAEVALTAVEVAWNTLSSAISTTLPGLIERLRSLGQSFVNLAQKIPLTEQAVGTVISILGVLAGSTIATVIGAVVSLATAWESNFLNIRNVTQSAAQYLQSGFRSAVTMAMNAIQGAITFVTQMTNRLSQLVPVVRQTGQSFLAGLIPALQNAIQRGQAFINRYVTVENLLRTLSVAAGVLATSILGLASPFNTIISAAQTLFGRFTKLLGPIRTLGSLLSTALVGAFRATVTSMNMFITASNRIHGVILRVINIVRTLTAGFASGGLSGAVTALVGLLPNLRARFVALIAPIQRLISRSVQFVARSTAMQSIISTLIGLVPNLRTVFAALPAPIQRVIARANLLIARFGVVQSTLAAVRGVLPSLRVAFAALPAPLQQIIARANVLISRFGVVQGTLVAVRGILPGLRAGFASIPAVVQQVITRANVLIARFGVVQGTLVAVRGVLPSLRAAFATLPAPIQQVIARAQLLISRFGVMQGALVAVQGVLPSLRTLFAALPAPIQRVIARANVLIARSGGLRGAIVALSGVIPRLTTLLSGLPVLLKRVATGSTTLRARMGAGGLHPAVIMVRDALQRLRGMLVRLPGAMQRVAGRATTLIARLGQAGLRGAVITLATSIPTLRSMLARIPGALKRVGGAVMRLIPRLLSGGLRGALLRLVTFIPTLVGALGTIGPALLAITGPIGVVVGAAATLYAAWQTNFLGIRDLVNRVMAGIRTTLQGDMSAIRSTVQIATTAINNLWHNHILPLADLTLRAFNRIREVVGNAMDWIWQNAVKPALAGIEDLYRIHGENLLNEIVETYDAIRSYIETFWSYIKPLIRGGTEAAIGFWQKWGDEILAIVEFAMDAVGNTIKIAIDGILTAITVGLNLIQGDWEEAWTAIKEFAGRTLDEILSFAKEWGSRFLSYITGLLSDLYQAFVDWANDLIFGSLIREMFNAILSAAETFGSDLLSSISSSLQNVYDEAQQQFQNILERAQSILNSLSSWVRSGWDIVSALQSTFRDAGSAAGSALRSAFNAAVPSSVSLPTAEVAGKTIGGGSMSLPQLATGGFIEEDGIAMLHEGERVLPEHQVTRGGLPRIPLEGVGGNSGGGDTNIEVAVTIEGDADEDDVERGVDNGLSSAMDSYNL